MHILFMAVLVIIVAEYLFEVTLDRLNLKAIEPQLPEEFKDTFKKDKYTKSQQYLRDKTKFGLIVLTVNTIITVLFLLLGGFNWLDEFIRSFAYNQIITGLLYILTLVIAGTIIKIPFSAYDTFVLEERYGFNKTTIKTFIADFIKSLLLSIIILSVVISIILWFFQSAGPLAWLYIWLIITIFELFLLWIAPVVIMPLFNKFTPLPDGELRTAILKYCKQQKYNISGLFSIDGSKRSNKTNAFFTGLGKNKRIALFDTLIEKHTVAEIVTIVAHEMGHYKKKHILRRLLVSVLHFGIMLYILSLFLNYQELVASAFNINQGSIYISLIFFGLLYAPINLLLGYFDMRSSRKHEFEADAYAAETTKDPDSMISTLKKLSADNLSNLTPHPIYVKFKYSHPPVLQRIKALQKQ